jgi:uncharacterized damage-inducible protein DinB
MTAPDSGEVDSPATIDRFYGDWRLYNDLVVEALRSMSAEDLALAATPVAPTSSTHWPIWAIAAHTAGARLYWLCNVIGLPGIETTPFDGMGDAGWEDDLDQPRTADELVAAWTTTWAIIEGALRTWAPADLDETVARSSGDKVVHLTRRSLLIRLMVHEAYHAGEIALIQGVHGRPELDLWPPGYHTVEATLERRRR